MAISKDKIEHIAKLAKINFTAEGKEKFFKEFSQIFDFVGKLEEVNTSGIGDLYFFQASDGARKDEAVSKSNEAVDKLMVNVPVKSGRLIKTLKIK
jgi:aspartyl-tRNA(Asn)/glutamyl-tRNA(Gln) amidotransferase subunit C